VRLLEEIGRKWGCAELNFEAAFKLKANQSDDSWFDKILKAYEACVILVAVEFWNDAIDVGTGNVNEFCEKNW
jgi:hypothetical protein